MTVKVNRRVSISVENYFDAPNYEDASFDEEAIYKSYTGGLESWYDNENGFEANVQAVGTSPQEALDLLEQAVAEIRSAL